jgi:hypothetical protein
MSQLKHKYESLRPLIIWLGLTELAWISYWLLRTGGTSAGYPATVVAWIVAMAVQPRGSVAVAAFAIALFGAVPAAREGVAGAAAATSDRELASIRILRLLAIGTIIKYLQRQPNFTVPLFMLAHVFALVKLIEER